MAQQFVYWIHVGQFFNNEVYIGKKFKFKKNGDPYDNDENDDLGVYERIEGDTHKILRYVDMNNGIYTIGYSYRIFRPSYVINHNGNYNVVYDHKNKILEVKDDNIELCFTDLPPAIASAGGKKSRRRKSKRSKRSRRPKRSRR